MSSSAVYASGLDAGVRPSERETFRKSGTLSAVFAERLVGCGNPATGSSHRLDWQAAERCGSHARRGYDAWGSRTTLGISSGGNESVSTQ